MLEMMWVVVVIAGSVGIGTIIALVMGA